MSENESVGVIEPVRKAVTVPQPVERAFRMFTEEMASWWPMATHSVAQSAAAVVVFEARQGGRIYERSGEDEESEWGEVRVWEPPTRFVMTWHPGRPADTAQTLEVRFRAVAEGTRVEVVHGDWERLGGKGAATRDAYDGGWETVLGRFEAEARGRWS